MKTKQLLFVIVSLFFYYNTQAQPNKAEAKRIYQRASDFYDSGNYAGAFASTDDLKKKMQHWTPKALYLHLKSAYSYFTVDSEKNTSHIDKAYHTFNTLLQKCDTLYIIAEKTQDLPDDLNGIEDWQAYFRAKVEEYAYRQGLTPQDAINFLNECAVKFPLKKADPGSKSTAYTARFALEGSNLKVVETMSNTESKLSRSVYVHFIDLTLIEGIEFNRAEGLFANYSLTERGMRKNIGFNNYKELRGVVYQYQYIRSVSTPSIASVSADDAFQQWKHVPCTIVEKYCSGYSTGFFDACSAEFQAGNYSERIKNAFSFLIDSFPKRRDLVQQSDKKFRN